MASTPETEVAKPTNGSARPPLSPTERSRRISEGMKAAHKRNPDAWKNRKRREVEAMRVKIRALLAKGFNGVEVRKKLGVSDKQVQLAKNYGARSKAEYQGPPTGLPSRKSTSKAAAEARHAEVRKFLAQGLKPKAVAARVGMNVATVYYVKARSEGKTRPSMVAKHPQQYAERPFAEALNWLKHASREVYKSIRAGREPSQAELYAILAYRAAMTGEPT